MSDDKKNPKEASNIFHSITKASVSKPATEKKNRNHYVVYWQEDSGQYVTATPRDWARQFGGNHGLDENSRTQAIEDLLKSKFYFMELTYERSVVLCHLDTFTPKF